MELVAARSPDAHIAAAPHAEVPGLPNVRETAAHVDVWQNRGMSRGQSSEVRDIAVSLVVEVVALQTGFKGFKCLELMFESRSGHFDLVATRIGSLEAHLKSMATTVVAIIHHQVVAATRQLDPVTGRLLLTMAVIVVDDLLAVQVQQRAVVRGGEELVLALRRGCDKATAPQAEVVGLPNMRKLVPVQVDVWQNLGVRRGQSSEIWDLTLSFVVEVLALQAGCEGLGLMFENRRGHYDFGVTSIRSLIAHLETLATALLAEVDHQVMQADRKVLAIAGLLLFTMAAIVVDDPLAVHVQERAIV